MKRFRSPTGPAAPVRLARGLLACRDRTGLANPHAHVGRSAKGGNVRGEQAPGRPTFPTWSPESWTGLGPARPPDRKSTRLNSSHTVISYAVFCLKKKKKFFYFHIFFKKN